MHPLLDILCTTTYSVGLLHKRVGLFQQCLEEVLYRQRQLGDTQSDAELLEACLREHGEATDVKALLPLIEPALQMINTQNISDHMKKIKEGAELLPVLIIYVPVPFTHEATAILGEWCREHKSKILMLDIQVDTQAVGGCAIVVGDVFHDFSLRRKMLENKRVVKEILATYA